MFAEDLMKIYFRDKKVNKDEHDYFFKHINVMFEYHRGTDLLAIDHSLSRHGYGRRHRGWRNPSRIFRGKGEQRIENGIQQE